MIEVRKPVHLELLDVVTQLFRNEPPYGEATSWHSRGVSRPKLVVESPTIRKANRRRVLTVVAATLIVAELRGEAKVRVEESYWDRAAPNPLDNRFGRYFLRRFATYVERQAYQVPGGNSGDTTAKFEDTLSQDVYPEFSDSTSLMYDVDGQPMLDDYDELFLLQSGDVRD